MRELDSRELAQVSGGEWEGELDFGVARIKVSGPETIQEIANSAVGAVSDAYWGARDAVADAFEWMAIGWEYSARCGQ
jgi:hypothetical protein